MEHEDDLTALIDERIKAFFSNPTTINTQASQLTNTRVQPDRTIHERDIQMIDGKNIQVGRTNGTMIGTADDQKMGFFGAVPVVQADAIASPAGGTTVDSQARTAIDLIRAALKDIGITK